MMQKLIQRTASCSGHGGAARSVIAASPGDIDALTVVVSPGHPWARRRSGITAAELASTTAIKSAAGAGAGPAVLSSLAVAGELRAGILVAVPVSGFDVNRPCGRPYCPAGGIVDRAPPHRAGPRSVHDHGPLSAAWLKRQAD